MQNRGLKTKHGKLSFEEELYLSLRYHGFLIPTTKEEVTGFEEIHGTTDFALPVDLTEPDFVFEKREIKPPTKFKGNNQKAKNDYFDKAVLAAEIAYQLHAEPTFGHIKFVKIYCLCTEVCNMQLSTNYGKYAAGPLDPKLMHSIDAELKKQKWFEKVKRESSYGFKYIPLENVEKYKYYYSRMFVNQLENIERIINLFRKMDSAFCEKVATLYFVWKEAIEKRAIINEQVLFNGFYAWDEKKKRFKVDELTSALKWMNENNIVPVK